jgi:phospholipase A2
MKTVTSYIIKITTFFLINIALHTTYAMENIEHHHYQQASVKINAGISDGEHEFLQKRLPIVKAALEKLLKHPLQDNQVPKITFICSGGGYRAALCTTGSLSGAQKIDLLDTITYITALSGSTWAVAPWISSGLSIKEFKNYIQKCMAKPFDDLSIKETLLLLDALKIKLLNEQPLTLVDPYGALLANRLLKILKDKRQTATLSQQAEKIAHGAYPYPIYTAIDGRENIITGQTWYEYTSHAIGERTNNTQIPTWAYGKKFENGISVNNAPEKSLAYHMGTWGSAFGANVCEILKAIIHDNELLKEIFALIPDSMEGDRILNFYAKVSNYVYKMNNIQDQTLSSKKHMKFVDSGLEINLPYPPVSGICSERTPDILIFLDASGGNMGDELKKVVSYAQKHNHPFPIVNFDSIDKKTISIFKDEQNKKTPVVIYMPRISDKELWEAHKKEYPEYNLSGFDLDNETNNGFCKTQHFQYSQLHSTLVMSQTEFNMRVNENKIIEAIDWWINQR